MKIEKLLYFILVQLLCVPSICAFQIYSTYSQSTSCDMLQTSFGDISYTASRHTPTTKCWKIPVPEESYLKVGIKKMQFNSMPCDQTFLEIKVDGGNEEYKFCSGQNLQPIVALSDVQITLSSNYKRNIYNHNNDYDNRKAEIAFHYNRETLICTHKNYHRCSRSICIYKHQVCDGVQHCENASDETGCETGVAAVSGVDSSRETAVRWLLQQRSPSYGWGKNTHRALTALYLAGKIPFQETNKENDLVAKQLELQMSVALLRNASDHLSISELSMFINALRATCHDPGHFYGYDLLQILSERVAVSSLPNPGAHLTLCNANRTFPKSQTENLLDVLRKNSGYPFHSDIQAMTLMALNCVKEKTSDFDSIENATQILNATVHEIIAAQLPNGSFGNIYTTALVAQALISSKQESNALWKLNSTIRFLMREMRLPTDFLSVYYTLPVLSGKSLYDLAAVKCVNQRKQDERNEISDITNKLGSKMNIQYTLYIGDLKDVIHTMYLRMPENSTAYDVMKMAQVADSKYKFLHRDVAGHVYVYEIAGITNDPEVGLFWLLYFTNFQVDEKIKHILESPDKFFLKEGEQLIMWYKTANI